MPSPWPANMPGGLEDQLPVPPPVGVVMPDKLDPDACDKATLEDVDFVAATAPNDQAVRLLRLCRLVHHHQCDLHAIAGPENAARADLLLVNANCQLRAQELVVYSLTLLVCVLAMAANLAELVLMCRYTRLLRSSTHRMVASLAASDLLLAFSAIYTTIMNILTAHAELNYDAEWLAAVLSVRSRTVMCLLADGPGFMFGCMMASVCTLTAIALEKYVAIFHPLKYYSLMTTRAVVLLLLLIWALALLFGLMPLMGWNTFDGNCLFVEKTSYAYLLTWASICLLCALLTFVLYFKIFLTARKHARQIAHRQANFAGTLSEASGSNVHDQPAQAVQSQPEPMRASHRMSSRRDTAETGGGRAVLAHQMSDLSCKVRSIPEEADESSSASGPPHKATTQPPPLSKSHSVPRGLSLRDADKRLARRSLPPPRRSLDSSLTVKGGRRLRLRSTLSLASLRVFAPPGVKAVKTLAVILGTFYSCWLPLVMYLLVQPGRYASFTIYCLTLVALLSAMLNPLVYALHSQAIKTAFRKLLRGSDWTTSHSKRTTDHAPQDPQSAGADLRQP